MALLRLLLMLLAGACSEDAGRPPGDGGTDAAPDAGDDAGPDCLDTDGDGHRAASCGGDDCDDADTAVHPGAPGDAWSEETVDGERTLTDYGGPSIAIAPDGVVHIAYTARLEGEEYWALEADNAAGAWEIRGLRENALVSGQSLAIDADGVSHLLYAAPFWPLDSTKDLYYATIASGLATEEEIATAVQCCGPNVAFWAAADVDRTVHFTYTTSSNTLEHSVVADGVITTEEVYPEGAGGGIAVRNAQVHIPASRGDFTNLSGVWELEFPGGPDIPGWWSTVTIDSANVPYFLFNDFTNDDVEEGTGLFHVFERQESGVWTDLVPFPEEMMGFDHMTAVVDPNDAVHAVTRGGGYISNASGDWEWFDLEGPELDYFYYGSVAMGPDAVHLAFSGFGPQLFHAWRPLPDGIDQDCDGDVW